MIRELQRRLSHFLHRRQFEEELEEERVRAGQ